MNVVNILIYAILCAVALMVVTGGFVSMTSGEDPSTGILVGGAVVGAALGAAYPALTDNSSAPTLRSISKMIGGGEAQTMKVGLPAF